MVVEITVTLALLVVTASMVDAFQRGRNGELGFDPDSLLVASVRSAAGIPAASLTETLARLPGVSAAAASTAAPFAGLGPRQQVSADSAGANAVQAERVGISPEFFSTLEIATRGGRTFTNVDSPLVRTAVVNETLAEQLFAGASIGRQIWIDKTAYDVVGVVADYASAPIEQRLPTPKVFVQLAASPEEVTSVRFLVRASGDPAALVQPVRRALTGNSAEIVVNSAFTARQMLNIQSEEMLLGTAPFLPLIAIGMLLTSSGIYGVLAFAIARRARELAVRVAVGAGRAEQMRLVISHSLRLLALGSACGIGLTFALSRIVRAMGGAGSFYDPPWPAFVAPVLIVLLVGALATWVPMRRVLRINPALLLRAN